jgi:hypothetical protein
VLPERLEALQKKRMDDLKQIFADIKKQRIRRKSGETYCHLGRHNYKFAITSNSDRNRCDMYQIGSMDRELEANERLRFLKDNFETTSCVHDIARYLEFYQSPYQDSAHDNSKHCSWASDLRYWVSKFIMKPVGLSLSDFPSRRALGFGMEIS